MAHHRVTKVSDIVKEGDTIKVKVLEISRDGKIRLSHKAVLEEEKKGDRAPETDEFENLNDLKDTFNNLNADPDSSGKEKVKPRKESPKQDEEKKKS